jgi:hypothetical protein
MNTIIVHPFNRVKSTPMHDMSAAIISPVSKWYIKPSPWWINDLEEVRLQPIVETEEIVEEEEDVTNEQEEDEEAIDETEDAEGVAFGALVDTDKGMNTCSFYVFNVDAFNLTRIYIRGLPRRRRR